MIKTSRYPVIDMKRTGHNIKMLLKIKGYSVKDVQQYLGLSSPQGVYHWLEGKTMPTLDNLYALSNLLCVSMDDLVKGNSGHNFEALSDTMEGRVYYYFEELKLRLAKWNLAG